MIRAAEPDGGFSGAPSGLFWECCLAGRLSLHAAKQDRKESLMNYAVQAASRPRRRYTPRKQARLADFVTAIRRRSDDLRASFKTQLRARDEATDQMFQEWLKPIEAEAFVAMVRATAAGKPAPPLEELMPEPRVDDVVRGSRE